jgi:hypothetical protein
MRATEKRVVFGYLAKNTLDIEALELRLDLCDLCRFISVVRSLDFNPFPR